MHRLLWLAAAGAAGTLCRYGLATWIRVAVPVAGSPWRLPLATVAVNLTGCLLIGALITVLRARGWVDASVGLALTVGFLGAFTTFSAYAFESAELLAAPAWSANWTAGVLNLILSPVLGVFAYLAGAALARSATA